MPFRVSPTKLATATGLMLLCQALAATGAAAAAPPGDLVLVSAAAGGEPGNGPSSYGLATSADGRYVAFASMATNLDPGDTDTVVDVFVKDLSTGQVQLASQTAAGVKGTAISERPSISADGQTVAFVSAADNLSPDDTDGYPDVFVKNLRTGDLTVASRTADGIKAATGGESATLSADGSTVAFSSTATNLSPDAVDGSAHVYVKRLDTGTLTPVDGGTITRPDEQHGATAPSLSADGQIVAFTTDAGQLDPADTDQRADIYVRHLGSGELRLASVNAAGVKGNSPSSGPSVSADGTHVAFATGSTNLLPQDTDPSSDVYVKNLADGSLRLASTDGTGTKANQAASYPSLSPDGGYLAFSTDATNLGIDTPPLVKQVYRKNLATGELLPVSVTADGTPGDYLSIEPSIAAAGAVVAFYTPSTNLVPDGGNRVADVIAKVFTAPTPPDSVAPTATLVACPSWLPANQGHRHRRIPGRHGRSQPVELTGSASDDRGLGAVSFSVTDEYREPQPIIDPQDLSGRTSATWQRQLPLDTTVHPGDRARTYTITATVSDLAGNTTTSSTHVIIWRGMRRYNR